MSGHPGDAALLRRWLLTAAVFALLALPLTFLARGPHVLPGDAEITRIIQSPASPALDQLALALTALGGSWPGEPLVATIAVLLLLALGHRQPALFVAVAAISGAINVLTKRIVGSPRPTADLVQILQAADGLGFPSGHAFSATLLYGSIWLILPAVIADPRPCRLLRGAAVLVAVGIAWSRVRLGAHWPTDVMGGFLWGMVVLSLEAAVFMPGLLGSEPRDSGQHPVTVPAANPVRPE